MTTTFKGKLKADRTAFWKSGNTFEKNTLGVVLSDIETLEKSGKTPVEFTDMQVVEFLGKEVKKRRATAETYANAGVADRAQIETAEADFLATYLPEQLTREAIENFVDVAIAELGEAVNLGQVMKLVTPLTKGRADGKLVSEIVRAKLS